LSETISIRRIISFRPCSPRSPAHAAGLLLLPLSDAIIPMINHRLRLAEKSPPSAGAGGCGRFAADTEPVCSLSAPLWFQLGETVGPVSPPSAGQIRAAPADALITRVNSQSRLIDYSSGPTCGLCIPERRCCCVGCVIFFAVESPPAGVEAINCRSNHLVAVERHKSHRPAIYTQQPPDEGRITPAIGSCRYRSLRVHGRVSLQRENSPRGANGLSRLW
jgi:hypothetical protein